MQSINDAHVLSAHAAQALEASQLAREEYINGMRARLSDDDLRRLSHDANHAASLATKAANICLGERTVELYSNSEAFLSGAQGKAYLNG